MASIVDSLVAPLSVINALVVALCMKKQDEVVDTLGTLEQIWDEYQVYSSDELHPVRDKIPLHFPDQKKVNDQRRREWKNSSNRRRRGRNDGRHLRSKKWKPGRII